MSNINSLSLRIPVCLFIATGVLFAQGLGSPDTYQVRYLSNLAIGDSVVNISNNGAGGASLQSGTTASITGALCANVYAFSPDEQLVSCCSCPVTPNGLVSLSAKNDLISNVLTPSVPGSLVVKLLATAPVAGSCNNSAAGVTSETLVPGMYASATTVHALPAAGTGLVGNLSLSGHATEVIATNGLVIDFDFVGGVSSTFPPIATSGTVDGNGDSGLFDITAASSGSFGGTLIGTTVTVHDLDVTQQPVGTLSGPGLPLTDFIKFGAPSAAQWRIALTELLPGAFTNTCDNTPGDACTPLGSPFNLINLAGNQVNVSFSFLGLANDGLGDITAVTGSFQTTFSNTTSLGIIQTILQGGAVVTSGTASLSATAIPGPSPYTITETTFSRATLSPGELSRLGNLCNFILANGSGFGVCRSCRLGGLGASHQ